MTFGRVSLLRVDFGAMRKLRDFWSHYGEDILLVFFTVIIFVAFYFLLTTF
jgi:hypothetical protein